MEKSPSKYPIMANQTNHKSAVKLIGKSDVNSRNKLLKNTLGISLLEQYNKSRYLNLTFKNLFILKLSHVRHNLAAHSLIHLTDLYSRSVINLDILYYYHSIVSISMK